jgi:uncharacterized LabA/DUF88 family protein
MLGSASTPRRSVASAGFSLRGGCALTGSRNGQLKNRVVSIIDGSNLHVCLKQRSLPTRLHFTRLSIEAAKRLPRELSPWLLLRTFYVTSSPIQSDSPAGFREWIAFFTMLQSTERLEVRLGRREGPPGARREKGVDTLITILLLEGALLDTYDVVLLFSSDGDFAEAVDAVRAKGKKVYNVFFKEQRSYQLARAANGFIDLGQFDLERLRFYRYR